MRLTEKQLRELLNGSDISGRDSGKVPKFKRPTREQKIRHAKAEKRIEAGQPGRSKYFIVIIARSRNETDPDNLTAKWAIDCLIGAVIPTDSSRDIIGVLKSVEKVGPQEPEETIIEVWKI